jgi:capsule polysaccharide export protein KpsE/RkpR
LIGLLIGTLAAFLLPKRFEARTQLMPPDNQSVSGMAMAALAAKTGAWGSVAGDVLGLKSSGSLFIGILTSATLEDRMVERFRLQKVYWTRLEEDARKKLEENTWISEDRKSGIITITVADRDPKRAAAMAQAYVEELDRLVAELSTSAAHRERVFLEERLQSVKQELDQAAGDLSQFESKNATLDIKEQGKSMVDAGAILMGQWIAAESELKGLEQIYTSNNVRVQSVRARIAELRRQLGKMRGGDKEAGETANSLYPSIRELPLLGVTYSDLYRRAKIKEAVYETLTQEYELARVEEAKETPSVKVLDAARVPQKKSFPPRLEIVLLCALLSLVGAALLTLARARWKDIDPSNPGKILAREVFGTVNARMPWSPTSNGSRWHAMTRRMWSPIDGPGKSSSHP